MIGDRLSVIGDRLLVIGSQNLFHDLLKLYSYVWDLIKVPMLGLCLGGFEYTAIKIST